MLFMINNTVSTKKPSKVPTCSRIQLINLITIIAGRTPKFILITDVK